MSRDPLVYLQDIAAAIELIEEFVGDDDFEAFMADAKTRAAVVRKLEVVGEATKAIPDEIRTQAPQIEWRKIAGMRDVLIHSCFGVDYAIVWDVIVNKLPVLKQAVRHLKAP